jgi:threonine/homoserine/homoserine lactone efflux protein
MDSLRSAFMKVRERLLRSQRAQTLIDYVFGVSAIALVAYSAYRLLG